ncbi:hypothetical protein ACIQAL_30900 [Pseudomonas sp. NPDC088368]|uniref:hypothetical protein n=1 Tax=Pseudomonas sp. NPDC088368 TaxID=3364453 RepID=UPI0038214150
MGKQHNALVKHILDQLQDLRETVNDLRILDMTEVDSLRGAQTADTDEALHLSFLALQEQLAGVEETVAMIAEATGDVAKR